MISYSHNDIEIVNNIDIHLQTTYTVWRDIRYMMGNMDKAMMDAINNSDVIIICLSKAYRASPSCNKEFNYAISRDKPIVVLKLDNDLPIVAKSSNPPLSPHPIDFAICREIYIDYFINTLAAYTKLTYMIDVKRKKVKVQRTKSNSSPSMSRSSPSPPPSLIPTRRHSNPVLPRASSTDLKIDITKPRFNKTSISLLDTLLETSPRTGVEFLSSRLSSSDEEETRDEKLLRELIASKQRRSSASE